MIVTYQGVDGLEAGLHGLVHRLARDNTGSLELDSLSLVGDDGTLTVDGLTESIDDAAKHAGANWHVDDGTGSLDNISFLNFSIVTKHDNTNVVGFEVKGHTLDAGVELHHLTGLDLGETEDTGNTVTDGDDSTELLKVILQKWAVRHPFERLPLCVSQRRMGTGHFLRRANASLAANATGQKLTTWLIWETFDWRMVTASPMEGFLEASATVVALKPWVASWVSLTCLLTRLATLDNILL